MLVVGGFPWKSGQKGLAEFLCSTFPFLCSTFPFDIFPLTSFLPESFCSSARCLGGMPEPPACPGVFMRHSKCRTVFLPGLPPFTFHPKLSILGHILWVRSGAGGPLMCAKLSQSFHWNYNVFKFQEEIFLSSYWTSIGNVEA